MKELAYTKTPIVEWKDPNLQVRLFIKLECFNHPYVSGNKWWKLKYNLDEARRRGMNTLLTFGGPYSNHIFATAASANELGLKSIGVIRGEEVSNPTLDFAKSKGMHLHFMSRSEYKSKKPGSSADELRQVFGDAYVIPEGGTNELAVKGCFELGSMLQEEMIFDVLCLPIGTGGTIAGIASALNKDKSIIGFSSLKGVPTLKDEIGKLITRKESTWELDNDYHFGGYAKRTAGLIEFMRKTKLQHNIDLDPVYTAKMMFGVIDLAYKGRFRQGSTVLALHTGGLQAGLYDEPIQKDFQTLQ